MKVVEVFSMIESNTNINLAHPVEKCRARHSLMKWGKNLPSPSDLNKMLQMF